MKKVLFIVPVVCITISCVLLNKEISPSSNLPSETVKLFFASMQSEDFETAVECFSNETIDGYIEDLNDFFDYSELSEVNISVEAFNDMNNKQKMAVIISIRADEFPYNYSLEVLSEEITGDEALVHILSKENGDEYEEDIFLILEDGKWKITDEY